MKEYTKTGEWISVQRPAAEEMKTHGQTPSSTSTHGAGERGAKRKAKFRTEGIINSVKC